MIDRQQPSHELVGVPVVRELQPGGGVFKGPHEVQIANRKYTVVPQLANEAHSNRIRIYEGNFFVPVTVLHDVHIIPKADGSMRIINGQEQGIVGVSPIEEAPVVYTEITRSGVSDSFMLGENPVRVGMGAMFITIAKDHAGKHFIDYLGGQRFEIKEDEKGMAVIRIGRKDVGADKQKNDIVVNDATVSAGHAKIFYRSGVFHVVDRDSTNGTGIQRRKFIPMPK